MAERQRVVLGVSGASGAALALKIADLLSTVASVETHLVVSAAAHLTIMHEAGPAALARLNSLCEVTHSNEDVAASIASGSFPVNGMIVAPCSMRTLAAISSGITDNLLTRAADVQLKERRKLVLLTRETPLHLGHLRNMVSVTEMGAIVMPPVPAFYHHPTTIEEIVHHLAARAIDIMGLSVPLIAQPWEGTAPTSETCHQ